MSLTDLETLRLRIADRPTFHHEEVEQEVTGVTFFRLDYGNILGTPAPAVYDDGTLKTVLTHYTIDLVHGTITFVAAPIVGHTLTFEYTAVVFTDDELQRMLDDASDNVTLAAVNTLLAWAADKARIAKKESMAGGGGMGSFTISTDMASREMRETAKALYAQYQIEEAAIGTPVEYITEVAWTEHMEQRAIYNWLVDNF